MKKITAALLLMVFAFTVASCGNKSDEPLQNIKGQEQIAESASPDKKYIITAYKNNGGATVDWSVLCTLTDNKTKETKNIYWQYKEDDATIQWIDNDTVKINDVTLDLPDETYDWRNN